jgi:hypothetical protein
MGLMLWQPLGISGGVTVTVTVAVGFARSVGLGNYVAIATSKINF